MKSEDWVHKKRRGPEVVAPGPRAANVWEGWQQLWGEGLSYTL